MWPDSDNADGDTSDVDFVVGADDAGEELLPEPTDRPLWRNPLLVAALAVLLALVVVGGVRLSGRNTTTPQAIPQPQAIPKAQVPVVHSPHVLGGPAVAAHLGAEPAVVVAPNRLRFCPNAGDGSSACESTHHVPRVVRAALLDHLPGARNVHGFEEDLRNVGFGSGGLWYREVHARIGAVTITITVARQHIPQPMEVLMLPQYVGFSFHRTGFFVRTLVHISGPQLVPILRLMALTRDPRLRAVA